MAKFGNFVNKKMLRCGKYLRASPLVNLLRAAGFLFFPPGPYGMGDVIVAVSDMYPNRKMLPGYINDDEDFVLVRPTDLIHSRHGDDILWNYPHEIPLLCVARVIRQALRRHGPQRDLIDSSLSMSVITGQRIARLSGGESLKSSSDRAKELQELAKENVDADQIDTIFWSAMSGLPGTHFAAHDEAIKAFVDWLHRELVVVEECYRPDDRDIGSALCKRIETLRKEGFLSSKLFRTRTEGRQAFSKLIRSAIHLSSKISGLAALKLIEQRVSPAPNETEIKMLSLLYGPCKELGGMNLDMLGRRGRLFAPSLEKLYQCYATAAGEMEEEKAKKELARIYFLSSAFLTDRREAWQEAKRRRRDNDRTKSGVKVIVPRKGDFAKPKHFDVLVGHLLAHPEVCDNLQRNLQHRTWQRIQAILDSKGDCERAAKSLGCTAQDIKDTVRKTIKKHLAILLKDYR